MSQNTRGPIKELPEKQQSNWSSVYWTILINQMLVVSIVALLAMALLSESDRACEAAGIAVPDITLRYFSMGPVGLVLGVFISITITLAAIGFRRRLVSVILASSSFVSCIVFLAGGIFASIVPLLDAIRMTLPVERQW